MDGLRSMVLPWRYVAGLYVVGTVLGAVFTRLWKGSWGSFLDPGFLLFSAIGWFAASLLLRWLANRSERREGVR